MTTDLAPFFKSGSVRDHINVEISFQIIGLFSEGLYSNPNKAIEELVSNSFDADATCTHVVLPPDRGAKDAAIVVLDNGSGMDDEGLKVHWIVGDSVKSRNRQTDGGRRTIGKFGIGKLAAYVLGERLTHITRSNGVYYSTSMDFRVIPKTADVDAVGEMAAGPPKPVQLELRVLTAAEAKVALRPWMTTANGRKDLQLFGRGAEESWTVAIMSDLKPLATELSNGQLNWILSTAMPLRDDFKLYLGDRKVVASKETAKKVGTWRLGKEITTLPKPVPAELVVEVDTLLPTQNYRHWRLVDPVLGPVTGYVEVFKSPIDVGKSEKIDRSNGFFVYVHERLVNPYDAGFGIDRNTLRHGTFSRFRVVVNMDRLDEELRSSRESLRDGPRIIRAREILQAMFNFARTKLEQDVAAEKNERRASQRLQDGPASLVERPIIRMQMDAFEGNFNSRHLEPINRQAFVDASALREFIEARITEGDGLVAEVSYESLGTHASIAILNSVTGVLAINLEHPFVAHFADEFGDEKKNLPLQLFAVAELLLEAELHNTGVDADMTATVLDSRDELLRHLAKSSGAQNSFTVAQELLGAASSKKGLQDAVVLAFNQLGFEAVPKGGNNESDGVAEAFLPGSGFGTNHYRVSLEAKSKETAGAKVKKKAVEVSTIARHRRQDKCDHAIVVGPEFETGKGDDGAVMHEIADDREKNEGETITLMRITDLARLVRIAPVKRANLEQLRDLFVSASSPDEAAAWVDALEASDVDPAPYKTILDAVWQIQQDDQDHTVDYGSLRTALRLTKNLVLSEAELRNECAALSRMAPNLFFAREDRVELNIKPEKVLEVLHEYVDGLPKENES